MSGAGRGRFAPSPSGRMHLGNLFSALLAWLDARSLGGAVVLRVEDLDRQRCRPEYAHQLADDLKWLGLTWDEGFLMGGPCGPYVQSERTGIYAAHFRALEEQGLVYPCYCARSARLAASAPHLGEGEAVYDGRCRALSPRERAALENAGRRPAWRVRAPDEEISFTDIHYGTVTENLNTQCGDFILRRSDGVYAYQLAVAADDGGMGVTRVVRGRDLLRSTARQIWLLEEMGFRAPVYCHAPLLLAPDGRRLSKRERDLDMAVLRRCLSPARLVGELAFLAGLIDRPEAVAAAELIPGFSWGKVPKSDIFLDAERLRAVDSTGCLC